MQDTCFKQKRAIPDLLLAGLVFQPLLLNLMNVMRIVELILAKQCGQLDLRLMLHLLNPRLKVIKQLEYYKANISV